MLKFVSENRNLLDDIRIFEVARVAPSLDENNLVNEEKRLAVVFASQTKSKEELFTELKTFIVDYAKNNLTIDIVLKEGDKPNFMHTYNTFRVTSREGDYGYIGVLHPRTQNAIDKRLNIVVLEVNFGLLSSKEGYFKKAKVPSKFQTVNFDVSVLTPVKMRFGELEQILNKYKSKIVNGYTLKEIYEHDSLGNNKSVTISYELSGKDHTLEGKEIEEFLTNLIAHLNKNKLAIRQ